VHTASKRFFSSANDLLGSQHRAQAPDVSVDPRSKTLTFINASKKKQKSFVVSVSHPCRDCDGELLEQSTSVSAVGVESTCTTFLAVLPPSTFMDVCEIQVDQLRNLLLSSDVHFVEEHPAPEAFDTAHVIRFPFSTGQSPFLCTQGFNGAFTHFQKGTFHAIDFACPVGTPVLAAGAGVVVSFTHESCASGIHVDNLFHWNSVMLHLDTGLFVEYVHIQPGSVCMPVGARVQEGDVLCLSGCAGFSPEPHVHIQAHLSDAPDAPTVAFAFANARSPSEPPFVPVAGARYTELGRCDDSASG
jgi:hypothetical protein